MMLLSRRRRCACRQQPPDRWSFCAGVFNDEASRLRMRASLLGTALEAFGPGLVMWAAALQALWRAHGPGAVPFPLEGPAPLRVLLSPRFP